VTPVRPASTILGPTGEADAGGLSLPAWSVVTEPRRAHIARVVALIDRWAVALTLDPQQRRAWHDAALWHDALRDAPESTLREAAGDAGGDANLLHGPAAAARLEADGEHRADVLDAVRWHTVGSLDWGATGRALFMADFLDPGRRFARADRAELARRVPVDFDGTFRQVVRMRLEWALREGKALLAPTVALWNAVR
jgi:HD superfamily phosphohydrolase YqeK